jgi:hypothetical protein
LEIVETIEKLLILHQKIIVELRREDQSSSSEEDDEFSIEYIKEEGQEKKQKPQVQGTAAKAKRNKESKSVASRTCTTFNENKK